ncbi:hypothetical protein BDR26DRAFT_933368 [Obelidium mucronatum]|nr:hypothetical protein BDR26DRAFT_933368 [Obelidium mucronatum]
MNSSTFAQYASKLVGAYSASYTDALVWWFASQNQSTQSDTIREICKTKYSVDDTFYLLRFLNSTFFLSQTVQNDMITCIDTVSNGTLTSSFATKGAFSGSQVFAWNPNTPKSYFWFLNQQSSDQLLALSLVCYYRTFPPQLMNTTFAYYRRNNVFPLNISSAMSSCYSLGLFSQNPFADSSQTWFNNQQIDMQHNAVLRLCANRNLNESQISTVFSLVNTENVVKQVKICLEMRNYGSTAVYRNYTPDSTESLVWLAFQNETVQAKAISNMCLGFVLKPDVGVFSIDEIDGIFSKITSYLSGSNLLIDRIKRLMENCLPFYTSIDFPTWVSHYSAPQTTVWLASQSVQNQVQFVNAVCKNTSISDVALLDFFRGTGIVLKWPMEVTYEILQCPRTQSNKTITNYSILMNLFWGLSAASCFGFFAFASILGTEIIVVRSKQQLIQRIFAPFNISLFICLITSAIEDCANATIWKLSSLAFATSANVMFLQQCIYLVSEISSSIWCLSYLYFCYARSETILSNVWPNSVSYIRVGFFISPLFILSPIVSQAVLISELAKWGDFENNVTFNLQALSAGVFLVFDVLLLSTFTRYIRQVHAAMSTAISPRFLIIARYGLASSFICMCYSLLSIIKPLTELWYPVGFSITFKPAMAILKHCVDFTLLFMKVSLFQDSWRESTTTVSGGPGGGRKNSSALGLSANSAKSITKT